MKKALVILLALTMVMSMMAIAPIGVAAEEELAVGAVAADYKPEGTAINNAAEFAAMAADGKYYLAADITIDATYSVNFTGTLDGNGKTITTSVPVFDQFNGTAMNLILKGFVEVSYETSWKSLVGNIKFAGVFANAVGTTANTAITNVRNEAAITSTVVGLGGIAGIAGVNSAKTTTTFTNCANYGFVDKGKNINVGASAGILAHAEADASVVGVKFVDCANYGDIKAYARIGGVAGAILCSADFVNCVNEGTVESINSCAGGVVGRITSHTAAYVDKYLFENCVNRGDVIANTADCGGVIGLCGSVDELTIKDCANYGDISCSKYGAVVNMGGIIAETAAASSKIVIENCVNYGKVGVEADVTATRTAISRAAGIIGFAGAKKVTKVAYCFNYGDIYGKLIAGGIAGVGMGTPCDDITYTACGNYGNVTAKTFAVATGSRAGGIAGHFDHAAFATPIVSYCFNLGTVDGDAFVGGLVGYSNANPKFLYNFVAGETLSTRAILEVADGGAVSAGSHSYSYEGANGVTRYFRAPAAGKVAITGDTVVFTSNAAYNVTGDVTNGSTVVNRKTYTFEVGAQKYAFYALADGVVSIDDSAAMPVVTVNNVVCNVIEWNFDATNKILTLDTYDHPLRTAAFVWGQQRAFEIDMSKNVVLEGVADMASIQGFGEQWWNMPTNTKGYVGTSEDDFKSGKVACDLNALSETEIFRQNLNDRLFVVDKYPTTDATHAKVVALATGYGNQLFEMNADVTPPTGDNTVYVIIALATSVVALGAVATVMVAKKRKQN